MKKEQNSNNTETQALNIPVVISRKFIVYIAKSWDAEDGDEKVFLDKNTCIAFCKSENHKSERYGWYEAGLYGL